MEDDEHPTLTPGAGEQGRALDPGTDVGGYLIEHVLGSGGMGVVYAATHPMIGKRAAVKVLRPELSKEPAAIERFVTEARSVNQIGHPNIVDIFGFGALADGRNYYIMDLLEGESLRTRLRRTGAVHISEAASFIDEISSALMAAHGKGIIHRDLKPDNVFMMIAAGRWPEVKLLDWGLAKLVTPTSKFRTVTGSVLGTPVYMSPEQGRAADTVDARTDIYALGVMSYELLCGDVPFRRRNSIDTMLAHAEDRVPPLGERVAGLPEELVQLIEAMLAKSPDERPTLAAVRAVLKRLKGTKIPTMTAAGISMTLPRISLRDLAPDNNALTVDRQPSGELTSPNGLPSPNGFASEEVRTRPPRSGPPVLSEPLPTIPRTMTGPPMPPQYGMPTPLPYQMPAPLPPQSSVLPLPPPPDAPSAPAPRLYPPSAYPQGSIAPNPQPFDSMPSMVIEYARESAPAMPIQAAPARRWLVILLVAIVVTAIGITIVLVV